ncbi:unnamed protein product [Rotaria sp. Silwood1]|nr:unnamed protein product [Rotaria sp. Silwood1]CAF1568585.1 unnamed protein product [Rotaria sp. Silwood1]CAF3829152.1 unnamed protein product [Rotaria sp. Silwood1]
MTDDDMQMVVEKIFGQQKTKCTGFILRDNALTSIGMKMFVDALLATRTKLKYLNLSNNPNVGDVGIEHLVYLLKKTRSITFLALSNTGITDRSVRLLADLLCDVDVDADNDSYCPHLEKLYLSFNEFCQNDDSCPVLYSFWLPLSDGELLDNELGKTSLTTIQTEINNHDELSLEDKTTTPKPVSFAKVI